MYTLVAAIKAQGILFPLQHSSECRMIIQKSFQPMDVVTQLISTQAIQIVEWEQMLVPKCSYQHEGQNISKPRRTAVKTNPIEWPQHFWRVPQLWKLCDWCHASSATYLNISSLRNDSAISICHTSRCWLYVYIYIYRDLHIPVHRYRMI